MAWFEVNSFLFCIDGGNEEKENCNREKIDFITVATDIVTIVVEYDADGTIIDAMSHSYEPCKTSFANANYHCHARIWTK